LTGAEGCTLTVFTTTGSIVHTQKVTGTDETIHLERLPAGLYLFRLEKDGKTKTLKAVNRE
ncbi:MAG: T9SS type A sorting domain-containing protein, partial [Bacteroidales bacterium]|nr:T9SS type A sorting domain-containing protein [Bacteroidales bacterium]